LVPGALASLHYGQVWMDCGQQDAPLDGRSLPELFLP
jgi:hypothetical protein